MADLEFFFDPVCPWAWITSRWVAEVQQLRDYSVDWRFISLAVLNEDRVADWYTPDYRAGHMIGLSALRIADEVRLTVGNDGVAAWYTSIGTKIHDDRTNLRKVDDLDAAFVELLATAGLDPALAAHGTDESHDAFIRSETAVALARAGEDVGTPIITFHPGAEREASFFGPVIATVPRGDEAVKFWDAIELIATTSGMAELKRSIRAKPDFT